MSASRPDKKRLAAERRGHRGEMLASLALRLKGYRILARRFRTKQGEVDIIARKGDLVAMVEVKARKSVQLALDSVSATAQRRISSAGDLWLVKQKDYSRLSIRYDVICVVPGRWPVHFKNVW